LVFEAVQESDGGFAGVPDGEILRSNAIDATEAFFFDQTRPERIRLHFVWDEVLSFA
jgi:hypothetical protein